jgi:hypothetical protein
MAEDTKRRCAGRFRIGPLEASQGHRRVAEYARDAEVARDKVLVAARGVAAVAVAATRLVDRHV